MNFKIRKANTPDFVHIHNLIKEFSVFQKSPDKVTITVEKMIDQKDHFNCLVAEDEHRRIIGYTNYSIIYYSWVGKSIYLDDLYVKPSGRGLGVGSKLMNEVFRIVKEEKCNRVRWQVSKWNTAAIALYKKLGAVVDDMEMNCDLEIREA